MITTVLWPYAWKAIEYRNNIVGLNQNGKYPAQAFGGFKLPFNVQLRDQHSTWGCPVYVLESKAADGMMPKWDAKARIGVYLGHSPAHAGSVALVLNPRTLHVSPQFYVVFGDDFSTVPYMRKSEMPHNWTELVRSSREKVTDEDFELAPRWSVDLTLNEDLVRESDASLSSLNKGEVITPRVSNLTLQNEGDGDFRHLIDESLEESREYPGFEEPGFECDPVSRNLITRTINSMSASVPVSNDSNPTSAFDMPRMTDLNELSRRRSS